MRGPALEPGAISRRDRRLKDREGTTRDMRTSSKDTTAGPLSFDKVTLALDSNPEEGQARRQRLAWEREKE